MNAARFLKLNSMVLCLLLVFAHSAPAAVDASSAPVPETVASTNNTSNDILRAYLELQQQIHETQLAVEGARMQSVETAARTMEALTNRLAILEQSLATQRARDFEATQSATHFILSMLAVFAVIGFLAVVLSAYFQWRMVNRLGQLSTALPADRGYGALPSLAALEIGDARMPRSVAGELPSGRLLGVIERLEKRVLELEHATNALPNRPGETKNGGSVAQNDSAHEVHEPGTSTPQSQSDSAARVPALLEKAQFLLNEEKGEDALACLDEALALDANNAEALVKKGAALEQLRKPQEAIECYDRAIAADNSMTIAYLHKGGLCNRLERFNEAMECYEQALRTQESRRAG